MSKNETQAVCTPDASAAIDAAFARIQAVPAKGNLIDRMSDAEWSESGDDWNINSGSAASSPDELDNADKVVSHVA